LPSIPRRTNKHCCSHEGALRSSTGKEEIVKRMNEDRVLAALEKKYPAPEWAFLRQVRDATGYAGCRTADAIAMGLWPSRGLELHGFEVKSYRSDWLRELKRPNKAEVIAPYTDRWWIVAGDETVVGEDEVPALWGLMVVSETAKRGRHIRIVRQAPKREDARSIDRLFLAAILRRVEEDTRARIGHLIEPATIEDRIEAAKKRGEEIGRRDAELEIDSLKTFRKVVEEFEKATGMRLDRFRPEWNADVVKTAEAIVGTERHTRWPFRQAEQGLENALEAVRAARKQFEEGVTACT